MKIPFVTGNKGKFEEACHILKDWELEQVEVDLDEIQGSSDEVIAHKARSACALLDRPLIVEDVSIHLNALGGFPGPYIKDMLKIVGVEGIANLVHHYEDHSARAICLAAYCEPGNEPVIFHGEIDGTIVKSKGSVHHGKFSWNPIFQPDGLDHTFGELTLEEHAKFSHRRKAFMQLKEYLEKKELVV